MHMCPVDFKGDESIAVTGQWQSYPQAKATDYARRFGSAAAMPRVLRAACCVGGEGISIRRKERGRSATLKTALRPKYVA